MFSCVLIFNWHIKKGLESTKHCVHGSEKALFIQSMPAPKDMVHMSLWRLFKTTMTFCGHCKTTWQQLLEISQWLVDTTVNIQTVKYKKCVSMCEFEWVCIWTDDFAIKWVWTHMHGWYSVWGQNFIQRILPRKIIDHLLCGRVSCWTAVSYVNGSFVQCSNGTNTFMRYTIQVLFGATVHKVLLYICKHLGDWNVLYFPSLSLNNNKQKLQIVTLKIDFRLD